MKKLIGYVIAALLTLSLNIPVGFAESAPAGAPAAATFSQAELDQILAPIALYPDSLLSQILMAATYPLEVVQAARWSKSNQSLQGEAAVRAVDSRDWDPSVKSLVAFPQILSMMDEKLDWTEKLGDAFLGQQTQVMSTVQGLRQKALAAGNLKSTDQYRVENQGQIIVVTSPNPEVVYVPYYDPLVVYGPWWWPAYRPVFWAPWPGYYARPGFIFSWSIGISIGRGFFFGAFDWPHRTIRVVNAHPFYYHRVGRPIVVREVWVHDYQHRRGVPYRNPEVQRRYVHANAPVLRHDYGDRGRLNTRERNIPGSQDRRRDIAPSNTSNIHDRGRVATEHQESNRVETKVPGPRADLAERSKLRDDKTQRRESVAAERKEPSRPEMQAPGHRAESKSPPGEVATPREPRGLNEQRGRVLDADRGANQDRTSITDSPGRGNRERSMGFENSGGEGRRSGDGRR